MAKGYEIKIAADVSKFVAGSKEATSAMEKMYKSLDEIGDEAKEAERNTSNAAQNMGDDLQSLLNRLRNRGPRIFEELGKKGQNAFEKTGDAAKDAQKAIEKAGGEAKKTGEKLGDEIGDGAKDAEKQVDKLTKAMERSFEGTKASARGMGDTFRAEGQRMNEVTEEITSELAQNWGETMSSFDGSVESAVGIVADSFGGLAGSMAIGGPIGALFLGGAAGLISAWVTQWAEGNKRVEERDQQMYEQMLENASNYFSQAQIVERFQKQMSGAEDAPLDEEDFMDIVRNSRKTPQEISLALADPRGSGLEMIKEISAKIDILQEKLKGLTWGTESYTEIERTKNELKQAKSALEEYSGGVEEVSGSIKENNDFLREHGFIIEGATDAQRKLAQAEADSVEAIEQTSEAIAENNDQYGSAEAAIGANKAALADLADSLRDQQTALENVGGTTTDLTALQEAQANQFIETAEAAGYTRERAIDLAESFGLIPSDVATKIREEGGTTTIEQARRTKAHLDALPKTVTSQIHVNAPSETDIGGVMSWIQARVGARTLRAVVNVVADRGSFA